MMEEAVLEMIRTVFAGAGIVVMVVVMRPAIRFFKEPLPRPDTLKTKNVFEETKKELQIPSSPENHNAYSRANTLDFAQKSPVLTAETIRKWLKEPSSQ